MAEKRAQRRLAAILAADVVGYSRLMEQDEAGTLSVLKARRQDVLAPVVAQHNGRVVQVMGDGVLVEFGSAVDAVQCAVELQKGFTEANQGLPEARQIALRIGINLGDVIVEGNFLYGDGVNVAARLEGLAEPGGIYVSASVHEQVSDKLELAFDDLGERTLKNIERPVRIYRAGTGEIPERAARPALALPDKPSIAVLPFENLSGDLEQQYFSDGITEDITTELSRFRSLFVIARQSSFVFKGRSTKVQEIARELGVAYIVEGSVRRAADRVRINAQLVDASTGNHMWAEKFDRDLLDIFAVQDEVARSVAAAVSGRVEVASHERAVRLSPDALRAYDLILRAKAPALNYTRADNAQALDFAERAVELDPSSARANAHSAWCHFYNYMACWTKDTHNSLARAFELAQRAVVLDETDSFAHTMLGIIHLFRREYDQAQSEILAGVALNPNDFLARRYYGMFLAATGSAESGIEQIELGRRLNPFDTRWVPWNMGIACFTVRRYGEAIAALRQARNPINEVRGWLAASYAQAGRLQEARATLEEFLRIAETDMAVFPGPRLKDWEPYWHSVFEYKDHKDFDHLFEALRKAGMQD